jgi:hypothetical protein
MPLERSKCWPPPLQGNFPTTRWAHLAIFADAHPITLPPNFKPGDYRPLVGFYDPATGACGGA